MTGLHIYMAGVGVQQLFILLFVVCAIVLHRKILRQHPPDTKKALQLLYVLYACLVFITVSTFLPWNKAELRRKAAYYLPSMRIWAGPQQHSSLP